MADIILSKITVEDVDGKQYEFAGGGGATRPGPNSVGTDEIEDEGVKKQDLEKQIQDKLDLLSDENIITEEEIEDDWKDALRGAGLDDLIEQE